MTSPVLGTNASMCAFIPLYSTSVSVRTSGLSASALSISVCIAVPIIEASFNSPSLVSGWSLSLYQTLRRQPPTSDGPICTCIERDRLASPARSAVSNSSFGSVTVIMFSPCYFCCLRKCQRYIRHWPIRNMTFDIFGNLLTQFC